MCSYLSPQGQSFLALATLRGCWGASTKYWCPDLIPGQLNHDLWVYSLLNNIYFFFFSPSFLSDCDEPGLRITALVCELHQSKNQGSITSSPLPLLPSPSFSASFFSLPAPSTMLQAPVTRPDNQWLPKVSLAPTVCQELKACVFPWVTSLVLQPYRVDFIYPGWHRKELRLRKFKSLSQGHRASGRAWPRDVLGWLGTGTTRILRLGSQHLWSRTQSHSQHDYF